MQTLLFKALYEGYSKQNREAVERLLKMEPKVECTGSSMRLEVQDAASTPGCLFFVDRGMFNLWNDAYTAITYTVHNT